MLAPCTAGWLAPKLCFSTHAPDSSLCPAHSTDLGTVSLLGWVDTIRDQGGIIFVDLRDRRGITQIKLEPHENAALAEQAEHLKPESVIGISGKVVARPAGTGQRVVCRRARSKSSRVRWRFTTFPKRRRFRWTMPVATR